MLKFFYYNLLIITLNALINVTHKLIGSQYFLKKKKKKNGPQRNLCSFWLILDLDGFELLIEFVCLIQSKVNIWCLYCIFTQMKLHII